ncbi:MAG: response regulator transcription factor [Saprospiraceae bacterium]|nr:response regulator transcription factor [Saprospiraceae bacterium]MCF8251319.1 response regulator transcription factor [Saprospiraceae bacterium]MCF8280620.1 response regulator transcription factor [Bacteroidales bacterium]MCF8313194.1 response regulator transcription factor [Saprospiraceae bacterium]MCF8441642.1 response regulator transcription factor [Saprospiraceae bacterium]
MTPKILLVEDDETLGFLLSEFLRSRDFEVTWAKDGVDGLRQFNADHFDLCLLDVMMPALDGFTVAELLRQRQADLPIIFLTAKSLHADVVRGFKAGADDYIKKPVNEEELVVRIQAVLKRTAPGQAGSSDNEVRTVFQVGDYIFDSEKCRLQLGEQVTNLTEMEARLLKMLCEKSGKLLQREWVLEKIWGRSDFLARKSMDVFISRLRKYLSEDPRVSITNLHGSGFVLEVP